MTIKSEATKVTSNPIGAIVGGAAFFYGAKKMGKVHNVWALIGITTVGVLVGAWGQSKLKAKTSVPNATLVVK